MFNKFIDFYKSYQQLFLVLYVKFVCWLCKFCYTTGSALKLILFCYQLKKERENMYTTQSRLVILISHNNLVLSSNYLRIYVFWLHFVWRAWYLFSL